MENIIKEACVETFLEVNNAWINGANRIELCANLNEGGTTPSYGMIEYVLSTIPLPIFCMIRPRGGSFTYSQEEIEIMKADILACKKLGVHGVVFGLLDVDNKIDPRTTELVELAKPMSVTFHKAFDEITDQSNALEYLITIKVDRILSSGGGRYIQEKQDDLNKLIEQGNSLIKFVACGGITDDNFTAVSASVNSQEFHGRLIVGSLS